MQRRSFLKILAGAACAIAAGIELSLPSDVRPITFEGFKSHAYLEEVCKNLRVLAHEVWLSRYRDAWISLCNA